jgi:glucose/arabinose dehydrogenase
MNARCRIACFAVVGLSAGWAAGQQGVLRNDPPVLDMAAPEIASMTVREGWEVVAATPVITGARFLEMSPDGTLFISRPAAGQVVACKDTDRDGVFDRYTNFAEDHPNVHGLCWSEGALYFADGQGIYRGTDADGDGVAEEITIVVSELIGGGMHWWRSLLVTPEYIYTGIGDSQNISEETDSDRQKIWRYSLSGAEKTLFAGGVRNTEKLRLRPGTLEVWGIDHGSDWYGKEFGENEETGQPITDMNPPDEFNRYEAGGFYGHPYIAGTTPRKEFASKEDIVAIAGRTKGPAWSFPAHGSSNGWTFVDPDIAAKMPALPADAGGDAFVAQRGSWNRAGKSGYAIVRVMFDKDPIFGREGRPIGEMVIVSTLARGGDGSERVIARPVDCVHATDDGSILFSCDLPRGRVYRLRLKQRP